MACIEDRRQKYRREIVQQQHLQVRAGVCTRSSSLHQRRSSASHHACKPRVSVPRQAALLFSPQERIRAKLANSAPPAPLADAAAGAAAAEVALPDDPDTLSARLAESEGEVDRWGRVLVLDAVVHNCQLLLLGRGFAVRHAA